MRNLAESSSEEQKAEWWFPGAGGVEGWNRKLLGNRYSASVLQDEKSSGD